MTAAKNVREALDAIARAVALTSLTLRQAVASRTAAKKALAVEVARYQSEHGLEAYDHYPTYVQTSADDGYEIRDAACDAAIAAVKGTNKAIAAARGKWRHATNRYAAAIAAQESP
mgnify:CR=1 FL=1